MILPLIKIASENHAKRIPTNVLNDVIMDALAVNPTPTVKGRRLKVLYTTQVAVQPPSFVVFVNDPEIMHFRSEEHTSELQSRGHIVCGLLLGKKKRKHKDER